jgi:hypothetical protein
MRERGTRLNYKREWATNEGVMDFALEGNAVKDFSLLFMLPFFAGAPFPYR